MKINPINFLIGVLLSALLAYALWSLDGQLKNYVAVGSFAFFTGTLGLALGGSHEHARRGVNLKVLAGLFFVLGLAINGTFAVLSISGTTYIVVSGIVFLIFIFVINGLLGSRQ